MAFTRNYFPCLPRWRVKITAMPPLYFCYCSDEWCRNESHVTPPALCMPAHTAPIDIEFYHSTNQDAVLPNVREGDAFVSWYDRRDDGFAYDGNG